MKRRNQVITPGGTITFNIFDVRDLPVSVYVGTNDVGAANDDPTGGGSDPDNNMVIVTANVYDNGESGGDGNRTQQTQSVDDSTNRMTNFTYDWRNRLTTIDGEIDLFEKRYYDNLNRQVKTERYDTDANGNLIARSQTNYDDLGRVYQTITYGVNPETGAVGHSLIDNIWYDPVGKVVKSLPAGAKLWTKTIYDSLSRPTFLYVGYGTDASYAAIFSVTGDVILTQNETVYDDANNVIQTTMRQRYHNAPATQTGALGDPSTNPKARVTYTANYPDALGRAQAMANYGTNGGAAFTRPETIPASSDTVLVNSQIYNADGEIFETTSPIGMVTRLQYNDAGKEIATVKNYVDLNSSSSSSSSSSEEDCAPSDDTNQTTRYSYNADGNQATLTAVNSRTGNQTATYTYGTTLSDSDIASSLLLRSVTYPNSVSGSDQLFYTYNRQRQRTTITDQRGCVHAFDYDMLGRKIQDRITEVGTGVDDAVRRLQTTYDVRGLIQTLSSCDNPTAGSGAVLNQVQKSYNDFQQLVTEYQSHAGVVNISTTPKVQYTFADGSANTVRPTGLVYPNGRTLTYDFGTSGGIDDNASRVSAIIDDDDTHLVEYQYLGQDSFAIAKNPQPDIEWTLASLTGTNDPETGDIYTGMDRFGRIKDCRWYNNSASEDAVRLKYGYNRASSRIWRQDDVARSLSKDFDELYVYDGLQRLKTIQRGLLNAGHDSISDETYSQCWDLDSTDNWTGMKQAAEGTDWTLEQSRTANTVNEITGITNRVGTPWAQPQYDPAGNMTQIPWPNAPSTGQNWARFTVDQWSTFTAGEWAGFQAASALFATWDAWNRMVKLTNGTNMLAEYEYDVLNRRIVKKLYTNGMLDQTQHRYQTVQDRLIEVRIDSSTDPIEQNIWGLMYIDGLVLRDRDTTGDGTLDERLYCLQDTNWNTVALADTDGNLVQRFCYEPFGTCEFFNANYGSSDNTTVWTTLFTGRELDLESLLYYFRARYLSSWLGEFLGRDPLNYANGSNLYAAYFVPNRTDPSGNISITFDAYIGIKHGKWNNEPGSPGYQFKGDEREPGQPGSSRLRTDITINICDVATSTYPKAVSYAGVSHQRHVEATDEILVNPVFVYDQALAKLRRDEIKYYVGPTYSSVSVKASAAYPFAMLAPTIDYDFVVVLTRSSDNSVQITVVGSHDAFPDYELLVDEKLLYSYISPDSGPGLVNLNTTKGFEAKITVECDCCCKYAS